MGIVGVKTYLSAKESLIDNTIAGLWTTAEFKEGEIFLYLDGIKSRTEDFASDGFIRDSLGEIDARPEEYRCYQRESQWAFDKKQKAFGKRHHLY